MTKYVVVTSYHPKVGRVYLSETGVATTRDIREARIFHDIHQAVKKSLSCNITNDVIAYDEAIIEETERLILGDADR